MKLSTPKAPVSEMSPPMASAASDQTHKIPLDLAFFDKFKDLSPVQRIALFSPQLADVLKTDKATEATEACAGLLSGASLDLGVPLPQWVKATSEKGWQAFGFGFIREIKDVKPEAIGKFVELITSMQTINGVAAAAQHEIHKLVQFIKGDAGNLPAEEEKQFAEGRMAVPKIIEKAKNPSERAIVFLAIACAWRQVEKLGSHAKTHKWLADNKFISPNTDRAETAKWFREIGLPKGKSGRPPKNTDCAKIE